jgi:STE24 endopeptidase
MAAHYAISFPLSLYSGFLLEHQYKLSRQSFWRWLRRYVLQSLLITGFGLAMIVGLFAIIWWTGPWWWWIATLATLVVTVILGQLVPVLILPLFYKIERLEDTDLAARFARLSEGSSLNVEGVYRMAMSTETVKANAMLAGLGRTRRVILGDTLLDRFTPEEIEVVFAHEMGHHVFHHISKLMLLGIVSTAASFFACDRIVVAWVGAQSGTLDYSQMPVYAAPMILMIVTLFSLIFSPLRNALSRRFETDCDRYALYRTGNRDAYRSAFSKLATLNKSDPDPHPLEVVFLHDHPPVAARLAMAQQEPPKPLD